MHMINDIRLHCFRMLLLAVLGTGLWSCTAPARIPGPAPSVPAPQPLPPRTEQPVLPEEPPTAAEELPSPGAVASLQLTEQGKLLLERERPDDALGVLERAVQLNPTNGENYYYISEAWSMKGNRDQAREFNSLAGIYLADKPAWKGRVEAQRKRLASGASGQ